MNTNIIRTYGQSRRVFFIRTSPLVFPTALLGPSPSFFPLKLFDIRSSIAEPRQYFTRNVCINFFPVRQKKKTLIYIRLKWGKKYVSCAYNFYISLWKNVCFIIPLHDTIHEQLHMCLYVENKLFLKFL